MIRPFGQGDLTGVIGLWNGCVDAGEVLYRRSDEDYFRVKILSNRGSLPALSLVAEEGGRVVGFISGTVKTDFLPGETAENTPGFLTVILVERAHRRRGIGTALLNRWLGEMKGLGKTQVAVSERNPVELDWLIPDTPGHDHNKAPGVDIDCPGYAFLLNRGFVDVHREVAMYLDLSAYVQPADFEEKRGGLLAQGIVTGRYDPASHADFDRMCDRVGSEYWRRVLRDETAKEHPRVILAAIHQGFFVGFTGPVDKQSSGRGWFTGICTDPQFERRGIAGVLFNQLMQEFILEGATFNTLFTGEDNHAQRLYLRTGFRPARTFAIMTKEL